MPVLRHETGDGILPWRKAGAVNDAPQPTITVNKGVFHVWHLLVDSNLVLAGVRPANKTSLVSSLFRPSLGGSPRNPATLDAIASDLVKNAAGSVVKDDGLCDLFRSRSLRRRCGRLLLRRSFGRGWGFILSRGLNLACGSHLGIQRVNSGGSQECEQGDKGRN